MNTLYIVIGLVGVLLLGGYLMIPFLGREKGQREYGQDMKFLPVPESPNCVMSTLDADHEKYISPLDIPESQYDTAIGFIKDIMVTDFGAQVLYENDRYLHTTVQTSLMRYVDDVEFIWDQEKQRLQVRSCSRLGYSDMGANRARVEQIRDRIFEN